MNKSNKKVLKTLVYAIMILLCGLFIYMIAFTTIAKIKNPNDVPMPLGIGTSIVLSGSMEPTIATNDLVFIKKTKDIEVGDIVLFKSGNSNVLHRIIKIEDSFLITKGDANNTEDDPIDINKVIGIYIGRIPGFGKVIKVLTSLPFIITISIIFVASSIACFLLDKKKWQTNKNRVKND